MKTSKLILLLFLVLSTLPLVFCACEEECEHQWSESFVDVYPTLENDGVMKQVCNLCGENKTESIPRLTHTQHTYSSNWGADSTHHWLICDHEGCQVTTNKAEHTWMPTQGGEKCQVCSKEKNRLMGAVNSAPLFLYIILALHLHL